MKYLLWSNVVVWGSLTAYAVYLWAKSASLRKRLLSEDGPEEEGGGN